MTRRYRAWHQVFVFLALVSMAAPAGADVIVTGYAEGSILRFADDGTELAPIVPPFSSAAVIGPAGITLGPDGNLYVSSQASVFFQGAPDAILQVNPSTGAVTTFINLESGYVPAGLRFGPDGNLYVSHNAGEFSGPGTGSVDVYNGQTGAFLNSVATNLWQPTNLLFDPYGNLYVSNFGDGSVLRVNRHGRVRTLVAPGSGGLTGPAGLSFGPHADLYVVDLLIGAVRIYDPTNGQYLGDLIPPGGALNNQFPSDLLFDLQGNLLIADLGDDFTAPTGNVQHFDYSGNLVGTFASGIYGASQLLHLPSGQ
jgi:sugar lactone lactonase YvrE